MLSSCLTRLEDQIGEIGQLPIFQEVQHEVEQVSSLACAKLAKLPKNNLDEQKISEARSYQDSLLEEAGLLKTFRAGCKLLESGTGESARNATNVLVWALRLTRLHQSAGFKENAVNSQQQYSAECQLHVDAPQQQQQVSASSKWKAKASVHLLQSQMQLSPNIFWCYGWSACM